MAVILVGCAAHDYLAVISPRLGMSILCNLQYFLAGFLLVDLYVTDWDKLRKHLLWDAVSLVCWAWIFLDTESRVHYFLPLLIVLAYVATFKGPISSRFFRLTWIALFGGMCYGIYLTHNLAITAVDSAFRKLLHWQFIAEWEGSVLVYIVSVIAAATLGLALYVTVERPCMDRNWPVKVFRVAKRRIWAREEAAA